MPKSPKLGKITFSSLSLPEQLQMSNLIDSVNILGGHQGPIELSNHLSLAGHKISNVGAAEGPKDVVTSEVAEANYSAKALRPHLEGGGKAALRTFLSGLKGDVTASGPGVAQSIVGSCDRRHAGSDSRQSGRYPVADLGIDRNGPAGEVDDTGSEWEHDVYARLAYRIYTTDVEFQNLE